MRRRAVLLALLLAAVAPTARADGPATDAQDEPLPPGAVARLGSTRLRHANRVRSVALTPDGTAVLAKADEGFARLWDARTGTERRRFADPKYDIVQAALSADGTMVAVAVSEPAIVLYETATGRMRRRLLGGKYAYHLAWSADSKRLAEMAVGHVTLWDVATGVVLHRVKTAQHHHVLAFAPDLTRFAAASAHGKPVQLWDVAAGKESCALEGLADLHGDLVWSPDGKTLAGACSTPIGKGSTRSSLRLWDAKTGKTIREVALGSYAGVAYSADSQRLAAGKAHSIHLWNLTTGKELRSWFAHEGHIPALAFARDGKTLASGSVDRRVRLWDVATGTEKVPQPGHVGPVHAVAFAPDGATLASCGLDCTLRLWDWAAGRERRRAENVGPHMLGDFWGVARLGYLPDGKSLLSMERDTSKVTFGLWDAATLKPRGRFTAGTHSSALACSPDGETFLSADWNGTIGVWEPTRGKRLRSLGKGPRLIALSLSPDGRTAAWAGEHRAFGVRDLATGKDLHQWSASSYQAVGVSFSPAGDIIAGATENGPIRVWDPISGKLVTEWKGVPRGITSLTFSPDGRLLAVAAQKEVVLWDVAARQEVRRFNTRLGDVRCLAFVPNGRVLASGQSDGTLLVWDVTGRLDRGRLLPLKLTAKEQDAHWKALAGADATAAHRAVWALAAAAPASLADFEKRLVPIPAANPKQIARLIRDLDDEEFDRRQNAIRQLTRLGEGVAPALRRAVNAGLPPEARRRAEELLRPLERPPDAERLRMLRAVAVLEYAGGAKAVQLLRRLADGAPEAALTRAARAALARRK